MPVTLVKILDIHSDAEFHAMYPDDEERAHREAAKAMEDCPFCQIQLSTCIIAEKFELPPVPCVILHEHTYCRVLHVVTSSHNTQLRAPPAC